MSKIAVITGAGAGVGRAVAEEFARSGWHLGLLSRDPQRLKRAAAELRERYGVRVLPMPTDVADADAVDAAATRVEEELGPIDTWVNVAMATVFVRSGMFPRRRSSGALASPISVRCTG